MKKWTIWLAMLLVPLAVAGIIAVMVQRHHAETALAKAVPPVAPKAPAAQTGPQPPTDLAQQVSALGGAFDGQAGIAVASIDDGWIAPYQADRIFPQQSVSKLWVATAILDRVDQGDMKLSDTITLTPADLTIFHQPVRKYIMAGSYRATIAELMRYAITQSDNTANDALYRRAGGQQGVGGTIARKTLGQIAIGPGEKILQTEMAGLQWDPAFSYGRTFWQVRARVPAATRSKALARYLANPPDGATPEALALGLARLSRGELLSAGSTAFLLDLMNQSKTGPDRLRGGLSDGWSMAHKTGTGQVMGAVATAYNDVGILQSPSGRRYALVVMIGSTVQPVKARQELMKSITRAVMLCEATGACLTKR
jgi:beta-lactamase class A